METPAGVVGVIIPGVVECFFFLDADIQKDANCQCSIISRVLDIVKRRLKERGLTMPDHLVIHAPRPGKLFCFSKCMVSCRHLVIFQSKDR